MSRAVTAPKKHQFLVRKAALQNWFTDSKNLALIFCEPPGLKIMRTSNNCGPIPPLSGWPYEKKWFPANIVVEDE